MILVFAVFLFLRPAAAAEPEKSTSGTARHFLWSAEGGKSGVFLLGSIHILKSDAYPLPVQIERMYTCCNTLVFESDLDGMNDESTRQTIMSLARYPRGQSLSKNISVQTRQMLEKKLSALGLPLSQFDALKPWFVAMTLSSMELQRLGFDPSLGVDRHFFNRARKDHKKMLFLETNEYQLNLFAGLSRRRQEDLLNQTLKELSIIEGQFAEMVDAWTGGDARSFEAIVQEGFIEYPEIYHRFIINRNRRWVPVIEKLMNSESDVLVIVGAGHLVGKGNLIELLQKKGYRLQQY